MPGQETLLLYILFEVKMGCGACIEFGLRPGLKDA
jgi:hypothetical protein